MSVPPALLLEMAERVWERDKRISWLRDEVARLTWENHELRRERDKLRTLAAAAGLVGVAAT